MSDAKQKRILLIGVGRWGANHLRILKSMPIELFVADHHEQRLKSAGVPETHRSTEPRSLFAKIDAAVVVTPAPTQFRHVPPIAGNGQRRLCGETNYTGFN
jgi:predicted dehydrogenase